MSDIGKKARSIINDGFFKRLKSGDHGAFQQVHSLYGKEMYAYIRSYFPFDPHMAEDLFQEVFLTVYTRIHSLKDISRLRSWLYSISSNKCIDWKRSRKNSMVNLELDEQKLRLADPKNAADKKVFKRDLYNLINRHLEKLPQLERDVFILREYQGLPFKEIVDITGATRDRVQKAMTKAMANIQRYLEKKKINAGYLA